MKRWLVCALSLVVVAPLQAAEPNFEHKADVIYGRKDGMCLTMDVFRPKTTPNGAGVILAVSGGWFSNHGNIRGLGGLFNPELLKRGYTIFAVVHGSQPKYTVPECVEDMRRAVRFIRHNAKTFGIDPDRLGVGGGSAGCHLSLMLAVSPDGNPTANDPINRHSSRVNAAAGFYPPTDFFNYGSSGRGGMEYLKSRGFAAPFDFREVDTKKGWLPVSEEKQKAILRQVSPVYHVSDKTAPCLIIHGDKDELVPIQQAEVFVEALKKHKVPGKLVVHPGGGHGWAGMDKDMVTIADWFDTHLTKKAN